MQASLDAITFYLSHNDISTDDTVANYPLQNEYGQIDSKRFSATWYNVDIGRMLEDYPDYEYFNLRFNDYFVGYQATAWYRNAGEQYIKVLISGLDFLPNYQVKDKTYAREACLFNYVEGSGSHVTLDGVGLTFRRPSSPKCNITIRIAALDDTVTLQGAAGVIHPRCTYFFTVYPVE